ncbi:MAG: hypothetical protein DWQ36_14615 [Acidobacteria bacterium]|mgnify:CR=1 FL=1|nr:MAG: hypothetical protein DWQ30_03350 [Acidobacteriota bacterium]REK06124.1 MAG: hypothetical protein DWQ36_14615 [Acidobacteriota bacterium]
MPDPGQTRDVSDRLSVAFKIESGKLVARSQAGIVIGETDRFLMREGAELWLATDDYIRYDRMPDKLVCTLYLWQEPDGDERVDKNLDTAIKVESRRENDESVVPGGAHQTFFDGDLDVNIGPGGVMLTHVAGKSTHAHYQFEIVFRFEWEFIWDPDVHDVGPRG